MQRSVQTTYYHICSYLPKYRLTVFTCLDIQDVAPDTVPSLGVGQHLDAVVGELLQASELDLLLDGRDVLHFTPL